MAMKIVRFNCCGMDVHKNLVVATIGITDRKTNITEYFQRYLFHFKLRPISFKRLAEISSLF